MRKEQCTEIANTVTSKLAGLMRNLAKLFPERRWESEYATTRGTAGLMLDLLGNLRLHDAAPTLEAATEHRDSWLMLWGVTGLIRLGRPALDNAIERAAADAETRLPLFENLRALGHAALFPARYHTQLAIAESEMVRWLIYPTELGKAPDEIEYVRVVAIEEEEGPAELFLFCFRVFEPHWTAERGWMAGVAGPYLKREQPTTKSLGSAFSNFEPLEAQDAEDHAEDLMDYIASLRPPEK